MSKRLAATVSGVLFLGVSGLHAQTRPAASAGSESGQKAICHLSAVGSSGVSGTVTFEEGGGKTRIKAEIHGLTPGKHGFHIHQFGDCSAPDGSSAGGHFNPTDAPHAGPDAKKRHAGDLGNIVAGADGVAKLELTVEDLRLDGKGSILGRGMIVHAGEDDLTTQPTGAAGGRVACGIIGAL